MSMTADTKDFQRRTADFWRKVEEREQELWPQEQRQVEGPFAKRPIREMASR